MKNLGPLDKRVRVEREVKTRDPVDNSEVIAWSTVRSVRATIKDSLSGGTMESSENGIRIAATASEVRMRWFPGLTPDMRLVRTDCCSGRVMNITGVAEIGRREGWACSVESYSTEGQGG